jgi:hypothetical protein
MELSLSADDQEELRGLAEDRLRVVLEEVNRQREEQVKAKEELQRAKDE